MRSIHDGQPPVNDDPPFDTPWQEPLRVGLELIAPHNRSTYRERLQPLTASDDRTICLYARELLNQLDNLETAA